MKLLILGSKEYPMGTNTDDPISSGGIEFYNEALVEELAKKLDVTVVTRQFTGAAHSEKRSISGRSKTEGFGRSEKRSGVTIRRVPWRPGFWTRTPSFILNSYKLAKQLDYDVILAHGPIATFFSLFLGKPTVAIPHGLASGQPRYPKPLRILGRIFERFIYEKSLRVVALSTNDVDRLRELSPKIRQVLIPTGINLKKFSGGKKNNKKVTILSTSRLIKVKGLNYLLSAASQLKGNFEILLAGSGPDEESLKNQHAATLLKSKVKFLGFRKDIPALLASADIFVLPSVSEGLPLGLLEAMACKCACVVTDIGLPVEHGETGLIVPSKDVGELAIALQSLIDSKKQRQRLAKNGRSFVSQFTWANCAGMFVELFERIK